MTIQVIGTIPRPRSKVRYGDHVNYQGIYVGLVVDVWPDQDDAIIAYRNSDGKASETSFKLSSLSIAPCR